MAKRKSLGRGLSALIPNPIPTQNTNPLSKETSSIDLHPMNSTSTLESPTEQDQGLKETTSLNNQKKYDAVNQSATLDSGTINDSQKENIGFQNQTQIMSGEQPVSEHSQSTGLLFSISLDDIVVSPYQPRRVFDEDLLNQLASSIEKHGVLQAIVVRQLQTPNSTQTRTQYELIAGERRYRASQIAGLDSIPAQVVELSNEEAQAVALVENIQREDLNPIEEANAYSKLIEDLKYTQKEVAEVVGKDRATIANLLRLLKLPEAIQNLVSESKLSMGHARALLGAPTSDTMKALAMETIEEQLSVRVLEKKIRERISKPSTASSKSKAKVKKSLSPSLSAEERDLQIRLQNAFGTKVDLIHDQGEGFLRVHFNSYDALDSIMNKVMTRVES